MTEVPNRVATSGPAAAAGEGGVDFPALREERLARLQESMRRHGMAACLFFHPANIRYATGASLMDVFSASTSSRYAVVPATGKPVLFEWEMGVPYSSAIVEDVRVAEWWAFLGDRRIARSDRMAGEIRDVLGDLGVENEEVGVDRLDMTSVLALGRAGIRLGDSSSVTEFARQVKTPEEVSLMRLNGRIGSEMMAEFEAAVVPGVAEYELFATLSDSLLRRRGIVVFARLLASGRNTNPWGSEAWEKRLEPGDVVAVDTDAIGYEGYLIDFSRTFPCGGTPSKEAKEAYRVAYDSLGAMREALRPGISYDEFARSVPDMPESYRAMRYDLMAHGAGLEDEGPIIYYPGQNENPVDAYLEENMTLCLECYAGLAGGSCGVKLEDQVLVTAAGCEVLCPYRFDEVLLGG